VRENFSHILAENHSVSHEILVEPMPWSFKSLYDPIDNMLDSLCFQIQFSFTPNDFKSCYDMDMIRQSALMSCSVEVLVQNSSDQIQACFESLEDIENTCVAPGHEVELTKSEYPVRGQVYLDPVAIYMEKLFITEPQYIPSILFSVRFINLLMMKIGLEISTTCH
jgi:hypothetical protein